MLVLVGVRSASQSRPLFLEAFGGGTLLDSTLEAAEQQIGHGNVHLAVTTDDLRIIEYLRGSRSQPWLTRLRPEDETHAHYFDSLRLAFEWAEGETGLGFETALILEPSHPLRPPHLLDNVIAQMSKSPELDTVVPVVREYGSIWRRESHGSLQRISNSFSEEVYREVAGLGLLTRAAAIRGGEPIGHDVGFVVVNEEWSLVDIHGEHSVEMARRFAPLLGTER